MLLLTLLYIMNFSSVLHPLLITLFIFLIFFTVIVFITYSIAPANDIFFILFSVFARLPSISFVYCNNSMFLSYFFIICIITFIPFASIILSTSLENVFDKLYNIIHIETIIVVLLMLCSIADIITLIPFASIILLSYNDFLLLLSNTSILDAHM